MPADLKRQVKTSEALQASGEHLREMATVHNSCHKSHKLKIAEQPKRLIDIAKNPSHRAASLNRQQVGWGQYAWMNPGEAAEYNKTLDQYAEDHRKKFGKPTEIDPRGEGSSAEVASSSTSASAVDTIDVMSSNRTGSGSNPSTETFNSMYWTLSPEGGWKPVQGK